MSKVIDERIHRGRRKIVGTIANGPYETQIGGKNIWVADVILSHDQQLLEKVAIAEYNFNMTYAVEGCPVELQIAKSGMFQVVGKAEIQKSGVKAIKVKPNDFIAKIEGLTRIGVTYTTKQGNAVTVEDSSETNYQWQTRKFTLGEMTPWDTYPLGHAVIERI